MSLPFDPTDPEIARWLAETNVALDDMRAVHEDRMRPRRDRDLGHRQQAFLFEGAWSKLMSLLGRTSPPPAPEQPPSSLH